jgi:hypothetical protein
MNLSESFPLRRMVKKGLPLAFADGSDIVLQNFRLSD